MSAGDDFLQGMKELEDDELTAIMVWSVADILRLYDCTETQAKDWLSKHRKRLEATMARAAFDYFAARIDFPEKNDDDE